MSAGFDQREFLEAWCEECARAIEMFSASKASITCAASGDSASKLATLKDYLWWRQSLKSGAESLVTWVGASQVTWNELGVAMADDAASAQSIYLEMLGQAEQGAATLLSRKLGREFRCQTGAVEQTCSSTASQLSEVKINFGNKDLPPFIFLMDSSGMENVNGSEPSKSLERHGGPEGSYGAGIHQFLDLELPLSVVLGRCVMQIQDVLKLTSGSVVELDSTASDRVEVVVQGKLVAKGEVVSVKGNYGVRITEIVPGRIGWN